MLVRENTVLVVIDMQEKLSAAMYEKEAMIQANVKMVTGAAILGLPVVWTEQNPRGLGPTVPQVRELLQGSDAITKLSFSCCGEEPFMKAIQALGRKQVLITGIECHVCVYQTVADLVAMGYEVQVVADAVSSRTQENKAIGLERCKQAGGSITSAETALFELLKKAEGDAFKQMLRVVK